MASFGSGPAGLTSQEAGWRLEQYGKNAFVDASALAVWKRVVQKLANPLVLLLLFAASISAATGDRVSAFIIAAIILCSVLLDTFQEHRAGKAAEHLKRTVALRATVLRDQRSADIPAANIVPGDIVLLRAGQLVPADGRIVTATDFAIAEVQNTIRQQPGRSLLIGVALLFSVPPVAILFMATVIGLPIGFALLLLYPLALLLGYLASAFFLSGRLAATTRQAELLSQAKQLLYLALALLILSLMLALPLVGGFVLLLAIVAGLGGWAIWGCMRLKAD